MPRIAIAQICPISAPTGLPAFSPDTPSEPFSILSSNLAQVEQCLQEAVAQSADMVIFPEYFLQGILNENRQYLSLMSKHLEQALIRLAGKYGVGVVGTIVHGSANHLSAVPSVSPIPIGDAGQGEGEELEGVKEWTSFLRENREKLGVTEELTLYNEAFYLDGQGVKGRYHKLNLWHPEREYLDPGVQKFPVFETKWGKAGFLICWDLSHPAEAQELASQGADIIFAPMYWLGIDSDPVASSVNPDPNYERTLVQSLSYARAFETECILISCNAGGDRQRDGFMGGSGIWAPLLGKIGGFEDERVGVEVVDVDMGILKKARDLYKIREDADKRCG